MVNNATLAFKRTDAVTVNNTISGTGSLNHLGAGTTTLTPKLVLGGTLGVSSGVLALTADGATHADVAIDVGSIAISGGKLDMKDRDGIVRTVSGPELVSLGNAIVSGMSGGSGITSSTAIGAGNTTVGFALAGDLGFTTFDGVSVASSDLLLRYVGEGDANLDGQTDGADLDRVFSLLGTLYDGPYFGGGDLNGDGQVDGSDLDVVYDDLGNIERVYSRPNFAAAAVPEPGSLALAGLGASLLTLRRRRVFSYKPASALP